jgi:hypothetical protein
MTEDKPFGLLLFLEQRGILWDCFIRVNEEKNQRPGVDRLGGGLGGLGWNGFGWQLSYLVSAASQCLLL